MSSRKLQAIVKTQYNFINNLLDRLEGKTKSNDTETERNYGIGNKKYSWYEIITLLDDKYFNGLTLEQILELAKKSIRLTSENCDLYHDMEDIKEICERAEVGGTEKILEIIKKYERFGT